MNTQYFQRENAFFFLTVVFQGKAQPFILLELKILYVTILLHPLNINTFHFSNIFLQNIHFSKIIRNMRYRFKRISNCLSTTVQRVYVCVYIRECVSRNVVKNGW